MPIVNFYTVNPMDIKAGDVLVVTVTLHVAGFDSEGRPRFSMYRCPYPNPQIGEEGVPQGDSIEYSLAGGVQKGCFPVITQLDGRAFPY